MKKAFIAVLILAMLFALAGCAAKAVTAENPVVDDNFDGVWNDSELFQNTHREDVEHGREVGEAYGFDMDNVPEWEDVKAARESADCAKCFWITNGILHVEVGGEAADLTPDEAVERYKDNPDFMREYINLMQYRDYPDPATYVDKDGEVGSLAYDQP